MILGTKYYKWLFYFSLEKAYFIYNFGKEESKRFINEVKSNRNLDNNGMILYSYNIDNIYLCVSQYLRSYVRVHRRIKCACII